VLRRTRRQKRFASNRSLTFEHFLEHLQRPLGLPSDTGGHDDTPSSRVPLRAFGLGASTSDREARLLLHAASAAGSRSTPSHPSECRPSQGATGQTGSSATCGLAANASPASARDRVPIGRRAMRRLRPAHRIDVRITGGRRGLLRQAHGGAQGAAHHRQASAPRHRSA
jgi:hypothetical protein